MPRSVKWVSETPYISDLRPEATAYLPLRPVGLMRPSDASLGPGWEASPTRRADWARRAAKCNKPTTILVAGCELRPGVRKRNGRLPTGTLEQWLQGSMLSRQRAERAQARAARCTVSEQPSPTSVLLHQGAACKKAKASSSGRQGRTRQRQSHPQVGRPGQGRLRGGLRGGLSVRIVSYLVHPQLD